MSLNKSECLLLNSDYRPITIVNWQKSIIWSLRAKQSLNYNIEILSYYDDQHILSGNGIQYRVPSIARSIKYFSMFNTNVTFSRKNLFLRDNYTCQYCGHMLEQKQLTYDHVIPKSRYKSKKHKCTNWNNIVTSCVKCNRKKGNKTPEEAGMQLINSPYEPKYSEKYLRWHQEAITIYNKGMQEHWKPYINLKQ